jgi:predicted RND superfamily exporter protein
LAGSESLRDRWILAVLRHHRWVIAAAFALTVIAGVLAAQLRVDSDLRRLLPRDHQVVVALEEIERTFGSTGSVNVVVKHGTQEARHAFTRALAERLDGHPLLRGVDYRLPSDFFARHALYYLSDQEMEDLDERIQAWLHYEFCTEAPDNCLTEPDAEAPEALEAFVDAKRNEGLERTGFRDMYEREGIDANVVLLHPNEPAARMEFAQQVSQQMRAVTEEVYTSQPQWAQRGMTYNVVGPYINKADEQEIIKRDTVRSGILALTGVTLILMALFRSSRAVLVLLVPLSCGVIWSLAATRLVIGDLNVMTSLISTVVMGAGIDAGIHFYLRARRERRSHDDREAIRRAFGGLIVPLLVASSTTVGAFLVMASSEFPAFREFGVIAAMGVGLCLLAMVTVLPALAYLVGIKKSTPRVRSHRAVLSRLILARPGHVLVVVAVLSVVAAFGARGVEFEFNGRALQSDHTREASDADVELISEIFGRDIHAGILVRPSLEATREALEHARASRTTVAETRPSVVAELFAAPDLLPAEEIDQQVRRQQIDELLERETIAELEEIAGVEYRRVIPSAGDGDDEDWAEEGQDGDFESEEPERADRPAPREGKKKRLSREDAALLLEMLEAEPFTLDDLPMVLSDRVRTEDGAYGIFAYPDFDAADMRKGVEFMRETRSYLGEDDDGIFVGETTVYAAMFLMLRQEAPIVLGMAAVLVAFFVYCQLRSLRQAMMTLLPLALAFLWLVAIMAAMDLRFTLFNLPLLPAILGIGVDNGVYLVDRIRRARGEVDGLVKSLQETGSAIVAATATTMMGFGAFMIADSGGLRGIGMVAALGIALAGVAATIVLPAISGVAQRWRARGA